MNSDETMSEKNDTIELSQKDIINVLLHNQSHAQQYATQESVNHLKERMNDQFKLVDLRFDDIKDDIDQRFEQVDKRFEQVDKRFEQVDKRFDRLENHLYKLTWLIVGAALTNIFKEHLFKLFGA